MGWFFNNATTPVSALLDSAGNQILETSGIMTIQVNLSKSYSEHTLENRQVVTDNVTDNQNLINITIILDGSNYRSEYEKIKTLFDEETNFTVQTKLDTYDNMYIRAMPRDEGPNMMGTVALSFDMVEQQIVGSSTSTLSDEEVAAVADQATVDAGQKTTSETTTVLDDLFSGLL